jgi:hypothetical protein
MFAVVVVKAVIQQNPCGPLAIVQFAKNFYLIILYCFCLGHYMGPPTARSRDEFLLHTLGCTLFLNFTYCMCEFRNTDATQTF